MLASEGVMADDEMLCLEMRFLPLSTVEFRPTSFLPLARFVFLLFFIPLLTHSLFFCHYYLFYFLVSRVWFGQGIGRSRDKKKYQQGVDGLSGTILTAIQTGKKAMDQETCLRVSCPFFVSLIFSIPLTSSQFKALKQKRNKGSEEKRKKNHKNILYLDGYIG